MNGAGETMRAPIVQTRPGPTAWIALDAFGDDVLAALRDRAVTAPAETARLNRFIASGETASPPAPAEILATIRDLLAEPALRAARDRVVTHLWLLFDPAAGSVEQPAGLIEALGQQLAAEQIAHRLFLYMETTMEAASACHLRQRVRGVLGAAPAIEAIFLVTDRDDGGRRLTPEARQLVAGQFASALMLSDAPWATDIEVARAFLAAPRTDLATDGAWCAAPCFATFALNVETVPDTGERAEPVTIPDDARAAFNDPAPRGWEPRTPTFTRFNVDADLPMNAPALPRWRPALLRPVEAELAGAGQAVAAWEKRAGDWRHEELARFAERCDLIDAEITRNVDHYWAQLRQDERAILADPALPGFFPLLDRFLTACAGDLETTLQALPPAPDGPLDRGPLTLEEPTVDAGQSATAMRAALARRINVVFVTLVAVLSALLVWWLAALTLLHLERSGLGSLVRQLERTPAIGGRARMVANALLALVEPDPVRVWVWGGLAAALWATVSIWMLVRGERHRLEVAFAPIHRRAKAWTVAARAERARRFHERATVDHQLAVAGLLTRVKERRARLRSLATAWAGAAPGDAALSVRSDAHRALLATRAAGVVDDWATLEPAAFEAAVGAYLAETQVPRPVEPAPRAARPALGVPAVPETHALLAQTAVTGIHEVPWATTSFLALPHHLARQYRLDAGAANVLVIPVDDIAFGVTIRSRLTAADLFGPELTVAAGPEGAR